MDDTIPGINNQDAQTPTDAVKNGDYVAVERDPLTLDIDDQTFIDTANKLKKESEEHFNQKLDIRDRRLENEKYLFGRQLKNVKLKEYNARYIDNIIYEGESYIKPMALSRMPDIIVKPGSDSDVSKAIAKDISDIVSTDVSSRARRRVLGLAFKHLPVYFIGAIKYFWNPEIGQNGDYDFKVVHPDNLILDHRAASNDAKDMDFIFENVEYTVKEWVMRFPDREQDFYKELRATSHFNDTVNEQNEAGMNSKVKGWEVWFTWYDKAQDGQFERIEGVAWYYNNLLFKKIKNPNWDWEGEPMTFTYNDTAAQLSDLQDAIINGQSDGMTQEMYFRNFFDNPEKPYIFMGYDQWGKGPLDETSRIEQALYLQQNLDKRGKQVTEMLDRARGKHVFSKDGGIKAEDIEEMDLNDPDEDLLVDGDVTKTHAFIQPEQPSAQMIQDKAGTIERIFDKMGVHGPARGEVDTDTPATNNQISREGDFSRSDDLAEDTINYAAEKMARAILQMIKLRYTQDHYTRTLGEDGQIVFKKINRDMIEDGMEVSISASGTDKLKAEQNAMDMAKLKLIDPLTFYNDMNMNDPKGRTEKLMLFLMQPDMYLQKFIAGNGTASDLAIALQNAQDGELAGGSVGQGGGSPQALMDIAQIQQGTIPPVPSVVDAAYVQTFANFMQDPNGAQAVTQQFPQIAQQLQQFAQAVDQMAKQQQARSAPMAPPQQPQQAGAQQQFGQQQTQANVGPTTGNPQPGNTSQVAAQPPGR